MKKPQKITDQQGLVAIETLLQWIGEDPGREGLVDTPKRVLAAFKEQFCGYQQDPAELFQSVFTNDMHYDRLITVKDIRMVSHCEHHMVPMMGVVHVAYVPDQTLLGLSKMARLVDVFSKRLQVQERLTQQIATALDQHLKPKGVAVWVEAKHQCMTTRGVQKENASTLTHAFLGCLQEELWQRQFYQAI